jgi:4-amino-4-deoxy-L-arabinose transferase-like glycosyltransferase
MLINPGGKSGVVFVVLGVLVLSAITAFWKLSAQPLEDHECYVSVTAREMLDGGSWIMPTFNGQPRLQKTPLSYWLVASVAKVTGKVDEFTDRLPSAVFAFLSAGAILYFVNRWLSFRAAVISAGVWVTSLGYIRYSHNARPEMALTLFISLCLMSFYSAVTAQSRRRQIVYMLVFWVSFGLGNLAKGPVPIPLVLIPVVFYLAIFRQWRQVPKLLPVAGILIFLAIMLPWPIAAAHRVNWDMTVWKREFIDRFLGEYAAGDYPVYFYFLIIFKYTAPWVVFLPIAVIAPFYRIWGKKQPVMRFLWLWFVADFVFLTLSGGKRQHYILPLMPAMAILTGILLEDMVFIREAFSPSFARKVLLGYLAAVPVLAIVVAKVMLSAGRGLLPLAVIGVVVVTIPAIIVAILFAKKRYVAGCAAIFLWAAGMMLVCDVEYRNRVNPVETTKRFAREVAEKVPVTDTLVAYGSVLPEFVHYFGRTVPVVTTQAELDRFYEQGFWIVALGKKINQLKEDSHFDLVYMSKDVARDRRNIVPGGLFHKSASAVQASNMRIHYFLPER